MPTLTLLAAHEPIIDITGPAMRAAGFYGPTRGLHTVQLQIANLRGIVRLEGTLSANPGETDWFPVSLGGHDQISFPRRGMQIRTIYGPGNGGESATLGFNFTCNCLYLRVRLIRSFMIPPNATQDQIAAYGHIDSVIVKY